MLELNDVKAGNIYYVEYSGIKDDYTIINCDKNYSFNNNSGGIHIKNKKYYKNNGWSCTHNIRLATDEEKAWLEHCIKEDKFVEYEEFMKVYKPQFIVGQWYKYKDWHIKFKKECSNGYFHSSEEIDNNRIYRKTNSCFGECNNEKILLTDLSEIQEFLPQDHPDKQLDIKQIQEECKKRFPIGCKYKGAGSIIIYTLNEKEGTYEILEENINAGFGQGYLYYEGKYAELIETPEEVILEYVECLEKYNEYTIKNRIYKINSWKKKNVWGICNIDCNGYKAGQSLCFDHWYDAPSKWRHSTKSAYDLQNNSVFPIDLISKRLNELKPLTPEQCYNTEIEVGDEVECVEGIGHPGMGFNLGLKFIVNDIQNYKPEKCYFRKNGHGVYENHLKLIKKANKNTTTTTLNKKVDVSSPKVIDRLRLKVRNQTTVANTEERIKLKLNHLKTIKIKQHVN